MAVSDRVRKALGVLLVLAMLAESAVLAEVKPNPLFSEGGELKGFTVCGPDKKFVNAEARIEGDRVFVSSPQVAAPAAVRYGWANCPVVNLFNKDGLPASPFRTDDFEMITKPK